MVKTASFKRLILRAVLRQVSPMVIRLVSVADQMPLHEFHDVFRTILGWNGDLGYIVRVHGQEINSFRRKTRSKALHEFLSFIPSINIDPRSHSRSGSYRKAIESRFHELMLITARLRSTSSCSEKTRTASA